MDEKDIVNIIERDEWMMEILKAVSRLNLPDWWIGAGFVRSKVWDYLHNYSKRTPIPDIDVIYFDPSDYEPEEAAEDLTLKEIFYENELNKIIPDVKWSVTNQSRMYLFHNDKPYVSSVEGMAQWVETATCVGVKLKNNKVILVAPRGIDDLVNLILRPNQPVSAINLFNERISSKGWLEKWPMLKIIKSFV